MTFINPFNPLAMADYIRFKSDDFKIKIPVDVKDIPTYIINVVNNLNPEADYILNDSGEDWVQLISYNDPQDIINFTKY